MRKQHLVTRIRTLSELNEIPKPALQRKEFLKSYRVCIHELIRRMDYCDEFDDETWLKLFSGIMLACFNQEVFGTHPKKLLDRIKELGYFDDEHLLDVIPKSRG